MKLYIGTTPMQHVYNMYFETENSRTLMHKLEAATK